jgi:hypothetical protein
MRKLSLLFALVFTNLFMINAQETNESKNENIWMSYWTNFEPFSEKYSESTVTLGGVITRNTTLFKNKTYLLEGTVYVMNNAILTIEPGTVLRGDFQTCGALVITKGAKLMANGLESDPIIFTSNKDEFERRPGDWGGIILLGDAPINNLNGQSKLDLNLDSEISLYGGVNTESNSGIMRYVRIEYAGRKLKNMSKEFNGLSLAGVGSKTVVDHIQISYSNDDSFECYGGNVNMSYLVSFRATDDDFDFTQGVQATISNSVAVRHPYSSDISGSRCLEIESYDTEENYDPKKNLTHVDAQNMVLVNLEDNEQGLVKEAINIKENSYLDIKNSIVSGFFACVEIQGKINPTPLNLAKIKLHGIIINSCKNGIVSEEEDDNDSLLRWFRNKSFSLEYRNSTNKDLFENFFIKGTPNLAIKKVKNTYITAK